MIIMGFDFTILLPCLVRQGYRTHTGPPHLPVDGDVEDGVDQTAANSSYLFAVLH